MTYKNKLKILLKSFHTRVNNKFKYKMMTNSNESIAFINNGQQKNKHSNTSKPPKQQSIIKVAGSLLHRFLALIIRIVLRFAYGVKGASMPPIKDITLLESATSLATKIRKQKLTSVEVLKSYIERIKEVNSLLNCVVDNRFDDALKDAAEADALIKSGKYTEKELEELKPFLGVPISTKDCIQVEGMINTSGLWIRRNYRASEDAESMALMRKAGAIPFALTNVSECCMWWESSNAVHGRTKNAYDTNRIVGGSSGGEGCIQSAAASPFGLGSDIGGSIRMPAFFNGVFGHKPSKFIVSNHGQFPAPFSIDQDSFLGIGPMCRYATDLKPMLKILSGDKANLLNLDEPVNLNNIKFYYQEDDGGGFLVSPVDSDIRESLRKVIKHFDSTLQNKPKRVQFEKFQQSAVIWFANMKDTSGKGFECQLANLEGKINPYWELLKWTIGCSNHTFIGLLTAIIEKGQPQHGDEKHGYLVNKRNELFEEMQNLLGDDGVFLYPTHPTVAPYHNEPIARTLNFSYTAIINCLGLPATAIPLGLGSEGLPIGIQVVSNVNNDRLCLAVAEELSRAFGGWVSPPTLDNA